MAELPERSGVEVELASPGGWRLAAGRASRLTNRLRVASSPVGLLLSGHVAVGGVPAVEFPAWLV
jgi:hypothetical protein